MIRIVQKKGIALKSINIYTHLGITSLYLRVKNSDFPPSIFVNRYIIYVGMYNLHIYLFYTRANEFFEIFFTIF